MRTIQIRNVPEPLYKALTEQAEREHRSLTQQALVTLERGIGSPVDHRARRKALLEEIRRNPIPFKFDPVALIREDRNR